MRDTPTRWGLILPCVLIIVIGLSLLVGASSLSAEVILHSRAPRAALALFIGAGLGVAGAITQSITRNPLASPQTLGVNGAAALGMVTAIVLPMGIGGMWPALAGAAIGGVLIIALALRTMAGPVTVALAGMAIHLLCSALVQAVAVVNDAAVDVLFWLNGSVSGAQWADVMRVALPLGGGVVAAVASARTISMLSLGPEAVRSLGRPYTVLCTAALALVVAITGVAVAIAGPIGFVGLIVPHVVRKLKGTCETNELFLCALMGAIMLVAADGLARVILWPEETPVGVLTALLGAPVFLLLARRTARGEH